MPRRRSTQWFLTCGKDLGGSNAPICHGVGENAGNLAGREFQRWATRHHIPLEYIQLYETTGKARERLIGMLSDWEDALELERRTVLNPNDYTNAMLPELRFVTRNRPNEQ